LHVLFVGDPSPDRKVGDGFEGEVFNEVEQGHTVWPEVELTCAGGVLDGSSPAVRPLVVNTAPLPFGCQGQRDFRADKHGNELVASCDASTACRDVSFKVAE
jgi:hypothetical protein